MKVLFIEDDEAIALGLVYSLQSEGYQVVHQKTKKKAIECFDHEEFDLLLLDVGLPDGSGYEICAYAKKRQNVPVIFLTAYDDEVNVVMGLDMGGDDYICKPFRIKELMSRIKSVMRRYHAQEDDGVYRIRHILVNTKSGKVYKEGEEILLTAMEYRLLLIFLNHPGQVLTRNQLLDGIWDDAGNFVNDNTLSVYIRRLREKLEENCEEPCIIVTLRGLGYRLESTNEKK